MNWDEIAESYLRLAEDRYEILLPALLQIIITSGAESVLDVGGGDGRFLEKLINSSPVGQFKSLALTDTSSKMLSCAEKRLAKYENIEIKSDIANLERGEWDIVSLLAVWMSLETEDECCKLLEQINSQLSANGKILIAVTHPCFRDKPFHSFSTNFDMNDYFQAGKRFNANLYDGSKSLSIQDTHWSLTDMSRQLSTSGFAITSIFELPDVDTNSEGAPWLVLIARPVKRRKRLEKN